MYLLHFPAPRSPGRRVHLMLIPPPDTISLRATEPRNRQSYFSRLEVFPCPRHRLSAPLSRPQRTRRGSEPTANQSRDMQCMALLPPFRPSTCNTYGLQKQLEPLDRQSDRLDLHLDLVHLERRTCQHLSEHGGGAAMQSGTIRDSRRA
jgi:hypothetical protein